MRCGSPSKPHIHSAFADWLKGEDEWKQVGRFRYCSFCGSLHPEDFQTAKDEGGKVSQTVKSYKFYISHMHAANSGRAKFYKWHEEGD